MNAGARASALAKYALASSASLRSWPVGATSAAACAFLRLPRLAGASRTALTAARWRLVKCFRSARIATSASVPSSIVPRSERSAFTPGTGPNASAKSFNLLDRVDFAGACAWRSCQRDCAASAVTRALTCPTTPGSAVEPACPATSTTAAPAAKTLRVTGVPGFAPSPATATASPAGDAADRAATACFAVALSRRTAANPTTDAPATVSRTPTALP